MTTTTPDTDGTDRGIDWLLRNARELRIANERDEETESWERGRSQVGALEWEHHEKPGHLTVRLDGDPHEIVLVTTTNQGAHGYVGACDCDGFRYHDGPCAHLVATSIKDSMDDLVPTDADRAAALKNAGSSSNDVDVVDEEEADAMSDVGGLKDVDQDQEEHPSDGGAPEPVEPADVETIDHSVEQPATPSDPFAKELASDVPERYVMQLHGETYIRRAGFAAIARQANLRPRVEPVVAADETDWQYARYRAEILNADGEIVAEEIGTAHLETEDLSGAVGNLDELAATRAIRRALEWATGAGASLQEGP